MCTRSTELAELVEVGAQQIVGALGAACEEGLSAARLTAVRLPKAPGQPTIRRLSAPGAGTRF